MYKDAVRRETWFHLLLAGILVVLIAIAALVGLKTVGLPPTQTHAASTSELAETNATALAFTKVKAAFLYNFAKLTEWPSNAFATADSPLVIGVLGLDPFGDALDATIKAKIVGLRKISIRRFKHLGEVSGCHLLFISDSERAQMAGLLTTLAHESILTVSDADGFIEQGGMIHLVRQGDMVRFKICPEAASRAGLIFSSKLLALATISCPEPPPEPR